MEKNSNHRKSIESIDSTDYSGSISKKNSIKSVSFSQNIDVVSVDNYKNINRKLSISKHVIKKNYDEVKLNKIKQEEIQKEINIVKINNEIYSENEFKCFNCSIF